MPRTPSPPSPATRAGDVTPAPVEPLHAGSLQSDLPPWRPWTVPAALALGFGLWLIASVAVAIAAHAGGSSVTHPTPAVTLTLDFLFDASFVAAALYFTVARAHARAVDFGYRRVRLALAVGAFVTAAVGYYVLTLVYASLFHLHGQEKLPSELGVNHSTAALVGAAIFVCVVAPIAEELFFRGFVFGALRRLRVVIGGRDLSLWLAAVLTGALFGVVHAGSASAQYLIPLGLLGFMLCLLRWRTGSLYPCMALHSLNNAVALGVNQLHWSAGDIVGLIAGALAVIAALTGPLAGPRLGQPAT